MERNKKCQAQGMIVLYSLFSILFLYSLCIVLPFSHTTYLSLFLYLYLCISLSYTSLYLFLYCIYIKGLLKRLVQLMVMNVIFGGPLGVHLVVNVAIVILQVTKELILINFSRQFPNKYITLIYYYNSQ